MSDDLGNRQQQFAARYSRLANDELLKIARDPWALSDAAWEALEDELDRRGLEVPRPPQVPSLEKRNLVLLRQFRDIPEALLAKGKLDSAGIPCVLGDENIVRLDWFISNLVGGVKILVDAEDFTEASRLLNEPIPEIFDFGGESKYEQPRCPKCQSLDVSFEELYKPIAFGSLFLNFPLPVHRRGWICHKCGFEWNEDAPPTGLNEPLSQKPPE